MLGFIPHCYKYLKMCDKAVDNCSHVLRFVPHCYKTKKMFKKTVSTSPSAIQFVPKCHKTQEICNIAVVFLALYLIPFLINI